MEPPPPADTLSRQTRRFGHLAELLDRRELAPGPEFACPYLAGRQARHLELLLSDRLGPSAYHALMDLNFRRLGPIVYRPQCEACNACRSLRVPVADFAPDRSQRRCLQRNADVELRLVAPEPTVEKHALYARYLAARHDGQMTGSWDEFVGFLYASPIETVEAQYWIGERLLAVALVDVEPLALSAVYCFYDPAESRRAPGKLSILRLIEHARAVGRPHVYLGYYVADCPAMRYKAEFLPCEVREPDGRWLTRAAPGALSRRAPRGPTP